MKKAIETAGGTGRGRAKAVKPVGEIVSLHGVDVEFSQGKRWSYWRRKLEELLDAPKDKDPALQTDNPKALGSIKKQAKNLGYKIASGEYKGKLYVKIVGMVAEKKAETRAAAFAVNGPKTLILSALKTGPLTIKEIARRLGVTPVSCRETLIELVKHGDLEGDGGIYRLAG